MCGIVGYVGSRPAVDVLIKGLKLLEYRGYDSAGVAFFHAGKVELKKSEGKLENVEKLLNGSRKNYVDSKCGIGHTRWATHGKPTTQNAHPHKTGHVYIVHNGIIENYMEIHKDIVKKGYKPKSETDSELYGYLVLDEMKSGIGLAEAARKAFRHLKGACSVVVMSEKEPGTIVGIRNGSPLVAATDPNGGCVFASDAQAVLNISKDVLFLEHGDVVVGSSDGLKIVSLENGKSIQRKNTRLDWNAEQFDKGGFPHFMLKEIFEQPTAMIDTLNGFLDRNKPGHFQMAKQPGINILSKAKELILVACGTSWHAALLGKYWIERYAQIPVQVELASEFRYRDVVLKKGTVVIGISQSGETADTLAVIRDMKRKKIPTIGISNVRGSTISREADGIFYMFAGPEVGVAATKTFLSQLTMLACIAGFLGSKQTSNKNKNKKELSTVYDDLVRLPHLIGNLLNSKTIDQIRSAAQALSNSKGFFYMGRGYSFPIALEGALKLKEIAYIHAEGYAGGELKHGPIAMIDSNMGVVVLAPNDRWREKTVSNLMEVKARGAKIVGVGNPNDHEMRSVCDFWIPIEGAEDLHESMLPFLVTPIIQLFGYELAVIKGTDVDKPRNLAKSVTVE
jgi:glutamine---fructose-6-phosphate transaminase (isomerizing)